MTGTDGYNWGSVGWSNPIPGDPDVVRGIGGQFADLADEASQQNSLLQSVGSDASGVWKGGAADAFHPTVAKLPGQLNKLVTSYREAGDALNTFWPKHRAAQQLAVQALAKAQAAQSAITHAKALVATAQSSSDSAATAYNQAVNPPGMPGQPAPKLAPASSQANLLAQYRSAQSNLQGAHSALNAANGDMKAATDMRDTAVANFEAAAREFVTVMAAASAAGIQNPHSSIWGDIMGGVEAIGSGLADAYHWAQKDVLPVLKAADTVLTDVSMVVGVVALVLAPIPGVDAISAGLELVNEGLMVAKTGVDLGELGLGDTAAESELVVDGIGLATTGLSNVIGEGAEAGADGLGAAEREAGSAAGSAGNAAGDAARSADGAATETAATTPATETAATETPATETAATTPATETAATESAATTSTATTSTDEAATTAAADDGPGAASSTSVKPASEDGAVAPEPAPSMTTSSEPAPEEEPAPAASSTTDEAATAPASAPSASPPDEQTVAAQTPSAATDDVAANDPSATDPSVRDTSPTETSATDPSQPPTEPAQPDGPAGNEPASQPDAQTDPQPPSEAPQPDAPAAHEAPSSDTPAAHEAPSSDAPAAAHEVPSSDAPAAAHEAPASDTPVAHDAPTAHEPSSPDTPAAHEAPTADPSSSGPDLPAPAHPEPSTPEPVGAHASTDAAPSGDGAGAHAGAGTHEATGAADGQKPVGFDRFINNKSITKILGQEKIEEFKNLKNASTEAKEAVTRLQTAFAKDGMGGLAKSYGQDFAQGWAKQDTVIRKALWIKEHIETPMGAVNVGDQLATGQGANPLDRQETGDDTLGQAWKAVHHADGDDNEPPMWLTGVAGVTGLG